MADAVKVFLAADLGASSGRVVAGLFDGGQLALEEVYRFDNGGVSLNGRLQWDLLNQWSHIQRGLRAGGKLYSGQVASIGVDTWGVDFGLLGRNDDPTDVEIRHAIEGNICRCTGYHNIVAAIREAASIMRAAAAAPTPASVSA